MPCPELMVAPELLQCNGRSNLWHEQAGIVHLGFDGRDRSRATGSGHHAGVDRRRRELVANVSHELRTPLTALCALLENLADGVADPDPETLRAALDQGERMTGLVSICSTSFGLGPVKANGQRQNRHPGRSGCDFQTSRSSLSQKSRPDPPLQELP